jgi:hypothetical protein
VAQRFLSEAARSRLHYVKVAPGSVSLRDFPDFLIAGPQRTGTTWIHENLRDHPDILWPRLKEIFFFSRLAEPDDPKFQSADLDWYLSQFRDPAWMRAAKVLLSLRSTRCLYRPKVRGDATASYAAMAPELIDEVVTLNPEIRVVIMVRDPVERAWSHAKKDLVRNRGRRFEDVTEGEFEEFFRTSYQLRCAQYAENIENWSSRLAAGHLYVGRFDDVTARPAALLAEICRFLGVRSETRFLGRAVHRPVNPTPPEPVPVRYRAMLTELLSRDIARLPRRFGVIS